MKQGFTVWELVFVVAIIGILVSVMVINGTKLINRAKFQSMVKEMDSIAQAAIDSYNSSNNPNDPSNPQPMMWPSGDASILGSPYMPQAVTKNPFGHPYVISSGNNMVTITTIVPNDVSIDSSEGSFMSVAPIANGQQVSISRSISNEFTGRLTYDLQYLYKK